MLNEKSADLHDHVSDVARLAALTAQHLGLPSHEVARIELGAKLHDVGKIAIPDALLNKQGPLGPEEWDFVHQHPEIGERIVCSAPSLARTGDLVRSSHERYDGAGYPDGLTGDDIPLGAGVIAVCDAFEAMTSARSHSGAASVDDALDQIRRHSGTQFHPDAARAFCAVMERQGTGRISTLIEDGRLCGR